MVIASVSGDPTIFFIIALILACVGLAGSMLCLGMMIHAALKGHTLEREAGIMIIGYGSLTLIGAAIVIGAIASLLS